MQSGQNLGPVRVYTIIKKIWIKCASKVSPEKNTVPKIWISKFVFFSYFSALWSNWI